MEIIELARQMCNELKNDEKFVKYMDAKKANDGDEALQTLIGEFNLTRMSLDKELSGNDKNEGKIKSLNERLQNLYSSIMANEKMDKFNEAKKDVDELISSINLLITKTLNGEDPLSTDISGCGSGCATCGGCH